MNSKYLDKIIEDMHEWGASVRLMNVLYNAGVDEKGKGIPLEELSEENLLRKTNCGRKSIRELRDFMKQKYQIDLRPAPVPDSKETIIDKLDLQEGKMKNLDKQFSLMRKAFLELTDLVRNFEK